METDIVVYDTNILIDILDMEILEVCEKLGLHIHTTSLVCDEIEDEQQWAKIAEHLNISIFAYDDLEQYSNLQIFISQFQHKSNLSMPDFSVLKLAKELSVPLYTSDRRLRNISIQTGVETHGSLHIVVLLNKAGLLSKENAIKALELLRKNNQRISDNHIGNVIEQLI